jgi:hypothetical protein
MQKTSNFVISLLFLGGAEAINLQSQLAIESDQTLAQDDDMVNPKYLTEMSLENWKLFNQSESL